MSFEDLVKEVERQKISQQDYVVDANRIHADTKYPETGSPEIKLTLPEIPGEFGTTEHGLTQICQKLKIPKLYVDRMQEYRMIELLKENLNAWFPHENPAFIRTLDGNVRAMLSTKYRPMDHWPVLMTALNHFSESEMKVETINALLNERRMHVRFVVPELEREVAGQNLKPGLMISNSEVGSGSFRVEPFLWRDYCANGMIFGEKTIAKVHLGGELTALEGVLQPDTIAAQVKATQLLVRDVIKDLFTLEGLDSWIDRVDEGTNVKIEQPTKAINWIVNDYGLPKGREEALLDEFMKGGDNTQWGLANAVTAVARELEDIDAAIELERLGGTIATIDLSKKVEISVIA